MSEHIPHLPVADLDTLIAAQRPGFSLTQPFYQRADIFEHETERIFCRQWLLAGLAASIDEPGRYFLYQVAGESIIVIRGHDGAVRAFFNVCRHRGSRICLEQTGKVGRLVCRYHAWAYELDGRLASWRHLPEDLDPADYGLHRCQVREFHGLIFLCLAEHEAPDFDEIAAAMEPYIRLHGLEQSRVAVRRSFPTRANWKLVLENFVECYHCQSSHPEFTQVNAYVRAEEGANASAVAEYEQLNRDWQHKAARLGYPTHSTSSPDDADRLRYIAYRYPLRTGFLSGTRDGAAAAPLMGAFTEHDGAFTVMAFGYFGTVIAANDYAAVLQFAPQDAGFTQVEVTWLVHDSAREGVDYDPANVAWLWDVTTQQDTDIIERNAQGVASRRYQPGPYSALEYATADFIRWYLRQIR